MALSELQYPSVTSVRKSENNIYCDINGRGYFLTSFVQFGYYPTIKQFVAAGNRTLKTEASGDIWLTFNEVSRKLLHTLRTRHGLHLLGGFET